MKGTVGRIYLPPDANCLLSMADHCFRSRNYVNLIVIDKQPELQWLDMDAAVQHCAAGASIWPWASSDQGSEPDVVLAAAGDTPTLEVVAAAWLLRKHAPNLRVRVVNVVDLMCLFSPEIHPHGLEEAKFLELFTADKPVVFAFHGYQRAIHAIIHGRTNTARFHVRGFMEEGTTTTPFDMVVRNQMSRFHLCIEALRRSAYPKPVRWWSGARKCWPDTRLIPASISRICRKSATGNGAHHENTKLRNRDGRPGHHGPQQCLTS